MDPKRIEAALTAASAVSDGRIAGIGDTARATIAAAVLAVRAVLAQRFPSVGSSEADAEPRSAQALLTELLTVGAEVDVELDRVTSRLWIALYEYAPQAAEFAGVRLSRVQAGVIGIHDITVAGVGGVVADQVTVAGDFAVSGVRVDETEANSRSVDRAPSGVRVSANDIVAGRDVSVHVGDVHHHWPSASARVVVGRIPRRASPFVDRAQVGELREVLARSPVVVCGMRGAGKTQVAAAHAREAVSEGLRLVGWVNAESNETLYTGLTEIAMRVGVADPDGDSIKSAHRLRDYLSEREHPALLVFDNATDPDLIDTLLPSNGPTRVVITSTDRSFAQFGEIVDVGAGFTREESVRYLEAATGLSDLASAGLVAEDLGDLPLALSAAAATIAGRHLDYSRYRQLLRHRPLPVVLPRRKGHEHPHAVVKALLLSIQTCETSTDDPELDAGVRWLLGVMAMLASDGVDHAMLPDREGRLDQVIERCVEGSLLSWSRTEQTIVMHRMLARVVRDRACTDGVMAELVEDAIAVVEPLLFQEWEAFQRRVQGARLIEHIATIWDTIGDVDELDRAVVARVLAGRRWATLQLINANDIARSIDVARATHIDHERLLGSDHHDTLIARHDLATAYDSAGRSDEAIALHERTLTDRERVSGIDHRDTLTSRNNLALAYESAERSGEAVALHERNLIARERILGPDHHETLQSRNNLAHAYVSVGRYGEAITLHERNVAECERVLGPDDPRTLTCRNNLVYAVQSAGQVGEAISLYERNLATSVQVLGPEHPDTLSIHNNLAHAYQSTGRLNEAIALYERNLTDHERMLGPDHPTTLTARNNLASAYEYTGRPGEAIALHERNLADRERVSGPDHPVTFASRNNLALAYESAGRVSEAIALHERNLIDRERVLGPDHSGAFISRNNLASAYKSAGRIDEAIVLNERNVTDRERVLGTDHPDTMSARDNLATAYQVAGRIDEAINLHEQATIGIERMFGPDHPRTLMCRNNLGYAYASVGRYDKAVPLLEQASTGFERVFGPAHPNTVNTYATLTRIRELSTGDAPT